MTPNEQLQALYKRYAFERRIDYLSEREFEIILLIFPSILVLQADGAIDSTEMMYLSQLCRQVSNHKLNISDADIRNEIRYLSMNIPYWREPFGDVLRVWLAQQQLGYEVLQIMIAAAASSTGNVKQNIELRMKTAYSKTGDSPTQSAFISEEEKEAIITLCGELEVTGQPGVIDLLQQLLG